MPLIGGVICHPLRWRPNSTRRSSSGDAGACRESDV